MKLKKNLTLLAQTPPIAITANIWASLFLCPCGGGDHISLKTSTENQVLARNMEGSFSLLRENKLETESCWQNTHWGNFWSHCSLFYFFTLEKQLGKWNNGRCATIERDDYTPESAAYPHMLFCGYCYFASLLLCCAVDCRPQWDSLWVILKVKCFPEEVDIYLTCICVCCSSSNCKPKHKPLDDFSSVSWHPWLAGLSHFTG